MRLKPYNIILTAALTVTLGSCGEAPLQLLDPSVGGENLDEEKPVITADTDRKMWASINGMAEAVGVNNRIHNNKILVSWRFLPSDNEETAFDLYRTAKGGEEIKLNKEPITKATCFQDNTADRTVTNTYRLTYAGQGNTLDEYTIGSARASQGLPYISIPIQSTADLGANLIYRPNDASIGDVDGDGENEIILKRVIDSASVENNEDDGGVVMGMQDICLLEAYKTDGTFLWRMRLGPNLLNRPTCFAVYDFDGDGRADIVSPSFNRTIVSADLF